MKKLFHKLHHVPSILLGVPLLIICLTGFILLFEDDVDRLQNKEFYQVEVPANSEALPLEVIVEKASAVIGDGKVVGSVTIGEIDEPYLIGIDKSKSKWAINQYTGEVIGEKQKSKFFMSVFILHRFFFDMPKVRGEATVGRTLTGVSTVFMVIILISGLVIWVPKSVKGLKNRLGISVTKGWKRFWFDTHVAGGFYFAILLLAISLTGLYWSFNWYRDGLLELVTSPEREAMVKEVQEVAYGQIKIAGYEKVKVIDTKLDLPQSAHSIIYSIHTGSWGGAFSKWLYVIAMLFAISFPITGYWLWIKKKIAKRKKNRQ